MGKILTAKQLAEYLHLSVVTIYHYANDGKIPGFKIGSRWRFNKSIIDNLFVVSDDNLESDNLES